MFSMIVATALLAVAPTVGFTSDSVYKTETIVSVEALDVQTQETEESEVKHTYCLRIEEKPVLGYEIYDDPNTEYIDGIKVNGEFLSKEWIVKDIDLQAEYAITVKTVYTDDIAGWLAMAKRGDFSAIMSHPVIILQLVYYAVAALSIILGGFGLFKARKLKLKSSDEIAKKVSAAADAMEVSFKAKAAEMENDAMELVSSVVGSALDAVRKQNETLLKATVLARSGDEQSTLALLELLKNSGTESVIDISEDVKARIIAARAKAEQTKEDAIREMKEAVTEVVTPKDGYDGTSI